MEHLSIADSLETYNNLPFEKYKEWLDQLLKLDSQTSFFFFIHINNFLNLFESNLGIQKFLYLEKQYYFALDLKLLDWASMILSSFKSEFGTSSIKVIQLETDFLQINQSEIEDKEDNSLKSSLELAVRKYKGLIRLNHEDTTTIKKYLLLLKTSMTYENIRGYIEYLNEYLKVYMDDAEIWQELAGLYIETVNYNRAIYCLEEVILHSPNNYLLYTKIGDLLSSFNNTDSAGQALKYYSKSILIKPTPRAFWGIIYIAHLYKKYRKNYDGQLKGCIAIARANLKFYYGDDLVDVLYDI